MPDKTLQEIHEAVKELRLEVEKNTPDEAKIAKIDTFLDEQEEKNQAHATQVKDAEKREEELKERMAVLEVELARNINSDEKNYQLSAEYKALSQLVVYGERGLDTEQKALLRTDSDSAGGFLVEGELDNMITKKITEISGIRSIARVRTVSKKTLEMPVRSSILTANYEGEAEEGQDDASAYASESLTAFRLTVTVPITMDMLMDASFNMESEILGDAGEAFAQKEGNKFVLGTGVKQPEGFTVNADVLSNVRTSATSSVIDADDMILLTGDLKVGYNPSYVLNRSTLAFLRTLKSTDGVFLWQPGMNGPVANTINGFPYILAADMADIASNSISVAFGDFQRGYTIIDRTGISIVRDELTRKKEAIIEFTINRWNYGQVTLPEAIKLLKTKT